MKPDQRCSIPNSGKKSKVWVTLWSTVSIFRMSKQLKILNNGYLDRTYKQKHAFKISIVNNTTGNYINIIASSTHVKKVQMKSFVSSICL